MRQTIGSRTLVLAALSLALAACDGQSGSSGSSHARPNTPPTITSAATVSVVEDQDLSYRLTATDAEGDPLTYSISGGADASKFRIDASGNVTFAARPDFDAPGDADGDNVYVVRLSVSDGRETASIDLKVTVENSREGIRVRRIASGFVSPVGVMYAGGGEILVAQRDGTIIGINPRTMARRNAGRPPMSKLQPNGLLAVTANSSVNPPFPYNLNYLYLDTAQRLMLTHYPSFSLLFGLKECTDVIVPYVDPASQITVALGGGSYVAVGDTQAGPSGAQDPASPFGKLIAAGCGRVDLASGLHDVRGIISYTDPVSARVGLIIADHGTGVAEEINYHPLSATPLNFGSPAREGFQNLGGAVTNAVDPALAYSQGSNPSFGAQIVGGQAYPEGGRIASLRGQYVFADRAGAILTAPLSRLRSGQPLSASDFVVRTADFVPESGTIEHPLLISADNANIYIMDSDGELYIVESLS